jgi:hypothetical protein
MKRTAANVALAVALAVMPAAGRPQAIDTPSLERARQVVAAASATPGGTTGRSASADAVTYLPADDVQAAFAKGVPLIRQCHRAGGQGCDVQGAAPAGTRGRMGTASGRLQPA